MIRTIVLMSMILLSASQLMAVEGGLDLDTRLDLYLDDVDSKSTVLDIRLQPWLKFEKGDFFFLAELDLRADNNNMAEGYYGEDSGTRKNLDLGELYGDYVGDDFFVRVGNQIFDFSLLDETSPSDILSPRDWNHLLDYERVPVPAINLKYGYDDFIQLVYVPYFIASRLPGDDNPWNPLPESITLLDSYQAEKWDGQFLLRSGTKVLDTDLVLSLFQGNSYSPGFLFTMDENGHLTARAYYNKLRAAMISASRYIGDWTVNIELAWVDQEGRDDYVRYGFGLSTVFYDLFREGDNLFFLIQYSDEEIVNDAYTGGVDDYDLKRSLNGLQLKTIYNFDDTEEWALETQMAYNTDGDFLVNPELIWWYSEFMKVRFGLAYMDGDEGEFFGDFRNNTQAYIKISWSL